MSDEFRDEVEAINSIYGDGCLIPSDQTNIYILTPPGESVSLRIEFPSDYPAIPPTVIGPNSTGQSGRKGDAARELDIFCSALENVYQPGAVCLFDAIEELERLLEEHAAIEPQTDKSDIEESTQNEYSESSANSEIQNELLTKDPPWILSDPVIEQRSTFLARCAVVSSTAEAEAYVQHLLASDKKIRSATHNMTAWRIRGPNGTQFQDCDDDGETAAGGRLLHLMQLMDLWDVMVVVTRWYGGVHLGPRRFALINQAARDSFVKAGLVTDTTSNNSKKKGSAK
ncbi:RWD repeat domain-containing protein [Xylariaceae sp. FL1019]|nr:RWD repeat domain-containing protein [Xylariaceae sp. FL1019]